MIDSRAEIHPDAKIAKNVTVGPWSIIGANVEIGEGCLIKSHVVIEGPTKIGRNNEIHQFATIGGEPQDKKFQGEETYLEIGDNNIFRENCTVHRGTGKGGGITRVGNNNLFMCYSHIAHDCIVANDIIFANNAALAGHVRVDDGAILSGYCAASQFIHIGAYSFFARSATITKDVLPFSLVSGPGAKVTGLNSVGLKRRGIAEDKMLIFKRAYKIIYHQSLSAEETIKKLAELVPECADIQLMIDMLQSTKRGICR